jgi:putative peptidoglycan lipid II flippase
MFKNTIVVTLFLILSSVLGFIAQIIYASSFGASAEMDIYFKLLSIPAIITGMAPLVFTSVLLPNFAKFKSNESELNQFIHSLWSYILLFSFLFSIIGCLTSIYNIEALTTNLSKDLKQTAIEVCLMVWIGSGLFIASSYLAAVLNYDKVFIKVAWTSILPALLMIVCVLAFHKYIGVRSLSLGSLLAYLIQFIIFVKAVYRYIPIFSLVFNRIPNFKLLLFQCLLVVFSLLPFTVFVPIGYFWASFLQEGSVSYLGYSQSFAGFLSVATGMGIAIVSFPDLADNFANGNGNEALYKFEVTLKYVLMISIFCAAAFISLRIPILKLFYQRGSFSEESVNKLASVVPWYLVSAIFIAGLNLLRTLFYSKGEYKSIAILGITIPLIFFVLAGLLKNMFSIVGIGIANAFSFGCLFYISIAFLKTNENKFLSFKLFLFITKTAITSIFAGLVTSICFSWISGFSSQLSAISVCLILFTGIYFLFSKYIFRLIEVTEIENIIITQIKILRK